VDDRRRSKVGKATAPSSCVCISDFWDLRF
jgi:hypothetical protein